MTPAPLPVLGRRARQLRLPGLRHVRPGRRTAVLALVLALGAGLLVTGLLRLRSDTGPDSFLPAGDPALTSLTEAARAFGGDPIVVLAESAAPRRLLDTEQVPRLLRLEGELARLPDVAVVYGPATVLNQVANAGQNLIATLAGRRDAARAEAVSRAQAAGRPPAAAEAAGAEAVAAFDRRYAGLLVRGLPAGLPTVRNQAFVNTVVFDDQNFPRPRWRFVVPSQNAVAVLIRPREDLDQAGTERLVTAVRTAVDGAGLDVRRVTVSGTPAIAAALGEQVRREIPLLGGVAVALIAACYVLVPWLPGRRRRLVPLAATLGATALVLSAFGWVGRPLTLGVVAFLPILVGVGSDFPAYLVRGAPLRRVLVTALAAATGFASLALSPLPSIRELGLALAAGVLLAVGIAAVLVRLAPPPVEPAPSEVAPQPPPPRARWALLGLAVVVAGAGWTALPRLDVEARPDRLVAGIAAVEDARHVEDVVRSSGEVQVVLRGADVLTPEALDWMTRAQDALVLGFGDELRPIVSLPDLLAFLGPSPTPQQIDSGLALTPSYLVSAVARPDGTAAVQSFGVRLADLNRQQQLFDDVRAALPPPPAGFAADVVGLPVAVARGYGLISGDRAVSNVLGIVIAGLVLLVGLRGRRSDALRAVLAASLATGWSLLVAWLAGVSLTPLTVALGSLTVATACEFTVVLAGASTDARARLRRTVLVAALAAGLGYAALTLSGLAVLRQFGLLLATTVALSFVAAQVVVRLLPACRSTVADPDESAETGREVTV